MGKSTIEPAKRRNTGGLDESPTPATLRAPIVLQIGLFCSTLALLWMMLGPEPLTLIGFVVPCVALGLGCFTSLATWFNTSRLSSSFKTAAVISSLVLIALVVCFAIADFDRNSRVLEPPILEDGRFIHRALGVSYAQLPQTAVNLESEVTHQVAPDKNTPRPPGYRLGYEEIGTVCRMAYSPNSQGSNKVLWSFALEVQRDTTTELSTFMSRVRRQEEIWSRDPQVKIIQPTHLITIGGHQFVEFTVVMESSGISARHVHIRNRGYILNFILGSEATLENPLFDEFLKSIQFE